MKVCRVCLATSFVIALSAVVTQAAGQALPSAGQKAAEEAQQAQTPPPPPATTTAPTGTTAPAATTAPPPATTAPPGTTPAPPPEPPMAAPPPPPVGVAPASGPPVHYWELPALAIPGEPKPELREEDYVGTYQQPRWTAARRFPTTRIYVIPEGKAEFEWWLSYTFPTEAPTSKREVRTYYEIGFGLGHRLQLDFYLMTQQEGHGDNAAIELKREQVELRYALADWGRIWGNPTLYLEYQRRSGGHDWLEAKVLLGGTLAPGWHGGANFVLENELGGPSWEHEYQVTGGISRTIVDEVFHIGVEGYAEVHDISGERMKLSDKERIFLVGPSFMVNPIPPMRLLVLPMLGAGSGGEEKMKPVMRIWVVSGWTF